MLRPGGKAKPLAPFREALEEAIARTAEAGEGGIAYRHLADLLRLYTAAFEAAKARRAGIDFEDLQILAARLLERAEIGQAYRGRFSHLLVDEFQDTNRLQLRLIEALQGPKTQLVVVGDELQSIYSFRHADLEVFRRRREQIDADPGAELMQLSGNFRSRPEVIAAVNLFGTQLLGSTYRPLRVGAPPAEPAPPGRGPAVELHLTARDGWDEPGIELDPAIDGRTPLNCLAEARTLAARLRELHEAGVERGAMVVLLRAFTHLDAHEDSLARAGLRPYVVGGRGYWSQQQVADVTALLLTIANPLDDEALFGALASPACAVAPDTLWLLRAAAGRRRHAWPALEVLAREEGAGLGRGADRPTASSEQPIDQPERLGGIPSDPQAPLAAAEAGGLLAAPERLAEIPADERALLTEFATQLVGLRARAPRLSLAGLIEAAVTETGYDLATLLRPAGEARLANLRKLSRLAAAYESREGRDLRGMLDFLAARAETDTEAQAATAAEGHDGVRIMTVHNAKGLEFEVVAVPDLSRGLLAGGRRPVLALGREQPPRVGLQWRRLGRASVNLYDYGELIEAGEARDAEEGLRLFHVAATRARERLILSGVVKPEPPREMKPGTAVIERLVEALGVSTADQESADPETGDPPRRGSRTGRCAGRTPRLAEPPAVTEVRGAPGRAAARARRDLPRLGDRGPPERALAGAGGRIAGPAPGRGSGTAARIGDAAAGRAQAADRAQPAALLHGDLGLRGMRLSLLHGARLGIAGCRDDAHPQFPLPKAIRRGNCGWASGRRRRGAIGAGRTERAGRRGARVAGVERGEWMGRAERRAGAAPRARRWARSGPSRAAGSGTRRVGGWARDRRSGCRGAARAGAGLARLRSAARRSRGRRGFGRRCRSCCAPRGPCCEGRSTYWSSARGRRRWSSTTRPTDCAARTRPSAQRTTRSSARSTRSPRRRASGPTRSRSPTSSSSAPTPRPARSSPAPTWTPARPASTPPSRRSAPATSARAGARAHLGPLPRLPRLGAAVRRPAGRAGLSAPDFDHTLAGSKSDALHKLTSAPSGTTAGGRVETGRQVVEVQFLQALADGVELAGAVIDQLLALGAEVQGLAQAGLAGVEAVDDLLEALDRGLVARRGSVGSTRALLSLFGSSSPRSPFSLPRPPRSGVRSDHRRTAG